MSNRNKDQDFEHDVSRRAYAIWEEEGGPDGKHLEHWQQALADIGRAREVPSIDNEKPGERKSAPRGGAKRKAAHAG
jgi:Protein of unknown function (DUF2934)